MNFRLRNRIIATVALAALLFVAWFLVDSFDDMRIRDDNIATVEATLPYRFEVERALKEGRQLPGPAARPPRYARALYANSDGAVFVELSDKLIAGGRYVFLPIRDPAGAFTWRCTAERIDAKYLAQGCR